MTQEFTHGTDTVLLARRRDVLEIRDRTQAHRVAEAMLEQLGADAMREQLQATHGDIADEGLVQAVVEGLLGGHFVVLRHEDVPRPYDTPTARHISDFIDPEPPVRPAQATHALEIVLQDEDGAPVAGARYVAVLPGGAVREGALDATGCARLERLPAGACQIDFPDLDAGFTMKSTTGL